MSILAEDIVNNFGGDGGREEFQEQWKLGGAGKSSVWQILATVLRMGTVHDRQGGFSAPYVYGKFPESLDAYNYLVAVKRSVRLNLHPDANSPMLGKLQWEIVERLDQQETGESGWWHVKTADGRSGYVRSEDVRSPIDYRAGFEKRAGHWLMTYLVAGD